MAKILDKICELFSTTMGPANRFHGYWQIDLFDMHAISRHATQICKDWKILKIKTAREVFLHKRNMRGRGGANVDNSWTFLGERGGGGGEGFKKGAQC